MSQQASRLIPLPFAFNGEVVAVQPNYGEGHINDTVYVRCEDHEGAYHSYIVQRINHEIFQQPEALMQNVEAVTRYLREEIQRVGGDPARETLRVIPTRKGQLFHVDEQGNYWRCYDFITETITLQLARGPEDLRDAGAAFGQFMMRLADFPADSLHETIPRFHDTVHRFEQLEAAAAADPKHRVPSASEELAFCRARRESCSWLLDHLASGELPLRVTHNDTKLNNILFDKKSGKSLCIVDLDTVMPGLAAYDFGDAVRFACSTALEDEKDLSKVHFSLELFKAYAEGYLSSCGSVLSPKEIESLAWGARLITFTIGMRFLADYLNGDVYFKTAYDDHNLVRARTQFKLLSEMEEHWDEILQILQQAAKKA